MDLHDKYVLDAKGSTGTLWVSLTWEGFDRDHPSRLPDGQDWLDLVSEKGIHALPENLWLEPWSSGRLVDWLWSGLGELVFSQGMLDVFSKFDIQGMETRPLTIRRKRNPDIEGYSLVRFTGKDDRVRHFPPSNPYAWSIIVSEEIKEALASQKLTGFRIEDAQQRWDDLYGTPDN